MNTKQKAEAWLTVNGSAVTTEAEYDAREIITASLVMAHMTKPEEL